MQWLKRSFYPRKKGVKECEGLTDAQKKRMLLSDRTNQGGKQVASQQHIMISGLHHLLIQLHHWWSSCSFCPQINLCQDPWSCFSVVSDSSWEVYPNVVEFCHNTQALGAVDTFCRGPELCRETVNRREAVDKENTISEVQITRRWALNGITLSNPCWLVLLAGQESQPFNNTVWKALTSTSVKWVVWVINR